MRVMLLVSHCGRRIVPGVESLWLVPILGSALALVIQGDFPRSQQSVDRPSAMKRDRRCHFLFASYLHLSSDCSRFPLSIPTVGNLAGNDQTLMGAAPPTISTVLAV